MEINNEVLLDITDESCVGAARRLVASIAQRLNFGEDSSARIALVTTEMTTNLINTPLSLVNYWCVQLKIQKKIALSY